MNFLKRLFLRRRGLKPAMVPGTDVDLLNKGTCPDCGSTQSTKNQSSRIVECLDCGSGFMVIPCCEPPYMSASHVGFNREKYRGKNAVEGKLSASAGVENAVQTTGESQRIV